MSEQVTPEQWAKAAERVLATIDLHVSGVAGHRMLIESQPLRDLVTVHKFLTGEVVDSDDEVYEKYRPGIYGNYGEHGKPVE